MAFSAQQSSLATFPLMPVMKWISLSSHAQYIPKHNVLIIYGNMNAQIGKDGNKFSYTIGKVEMANISQILHLRTVFHAQTLNSKKGGKTTQIMLKHRLYTYEQELDIVQSARAAEYTDCISAEG